MVPFESLGTVSYSNSIATMAVSLAVSTQHTNVTIDRRSKYLRFSKRSASNDHTSPQRQARKLALPNAPKHAISIFKKYIIIFYKWFTAISQTPYLYPFGDYGASIYKTSALGPSF